MTNTTVQMDKAGDLGREHGFNVGSWVIDGNTSEETKLRCLKLDEDGDPAWDDEFGAPAPLSGEWADAPRPDDIVIEAGRDYEDISDWDRQELLDEYERCWFEAYRDEVLRSASASLAA